MIIGFYPTYESHTPHYGPPPAYPNPAVNSGEGLTDQTYRSSDINQTGHVNQPGSVNPSGTIDQSGNVNPPGNVNVPANINYANNVSQSGNMINQYPCKENMVAENDHMRQYIDKIIETERKYFDNEYRYPNPIDSGTQHVRSSCAYPQMPMDTSTTSSVQTGTRDFARRPQNMYPRIDMKSYKYEPKPLERRKQPRAFVSTEEKNDDYWERRKKNNLAARKSREERRKKEIEVMAIVDTLSRENVKMKYYAQKMMEDNRSLQLEIEMLKRI